MKFLVFQHVEHEHPGLIGQYAQGNGIALEIVELWKPYVLPPAAGFDALIILGGPMAAYENYSSRNDEVKFVQQIFSKIPILGLCLGAQLLAYALGAKVYKNNKKEIGYYDVELTNQGLRDKIFTGFHSPFKVLQWHGDTFDLPDNSKLLAESPDCKNQAFACQNSYGLQFHLEFTTEMVNQLLEIDKDWIHEDFEINNEQVKRETKNYESLIKEQCFKLLDNFIALNKNK